MPTSSYAPDTKVEIAFNAGVQTPAASRVWTDVSTYVELAENITITWGRQDERSTADANHLTLTLDNSDGRFTFGKTTGPYGSNVKLGRPIRVTATPVDGAISTRFLGFIDELPTEWDGTDAYAKAPISATSRLSRLGTQAQLKSLVETAILTDSPTAYYTLGEPTGATQANDSSGNRADPFTLIDNADLPVVFGSATGPGTDSLTAAQFAGGQYLVRYGTSFTTAFTVEFFFLRSGLPVANETLWASQFAQARIFIDTAGKVNGFVPSSLSVVSSANLADGATHHVAMTFAGTASIELFIDGVSQGTSTASPAGSGSSGPQVLLGQLLTGVIAHYAEWTTVLSPAQIAAHAATGLTGYAGDTTSARLIRYAGYAGIPSTEISAETGQTTVQHVDTTDKQAVELMRVMETTEGGVLYDERDGTLTFHNRAHRLTTASSFTLSMASQTVEADYAPKADRTAIANDVTAQDVSGRFTAHLFDATSQSDNGVATTSIETASQDDDEPLFQAGWTLNKFKDVRERVPALTVNALAQVGKTPNCSTVMAATVGTKITVSNRPTQAASSTVDYFIEGGTEVYGPESLFITWNLSPSSPEDQTFVVGDPTRGVIGVNPIGL